MTKIKTYPIDTNITGSDKWVGTDAQSYGSTKNFTVSGLSDYFNSFSAINLSNSLKFKYDTVDLGDDRAAGSFSFETEVGSTVSFSSISSLMFHKNTSNGKYVVDFMTSLEGTVIMISKVDEPNMFALYNVNSYDQNPIETDFYDVSLSYVVGNGSIDEDEYYFVSLIETPSLSTGFTATVSDTATISHNLSATDVIVQLYDTVTNETVYADVERINTNQVTVTFSATPTNSIRVLVQKIG